MSEDPLDKTTSIGADLTPAGLNFKAKSRFVAALDRLCGNVVDFANVPIERRLSRDRTKIEADKQIIEAMTKLAVERMGTDQEFAERVLRNHLGLAFDRQENKDGVVRHAIEDLRRDSSADEASPELDPGFLHGFERHAEDAATEQLREKWGRVLAAEIRKPGTVTRKVMRIVDEIDPQAAQTFEQLCSSRLGKVIPRCLAGALDFATVTLLVSAGLIMDPGITGHQVQLRAESANDGTALWFFNTTTVGFAIPRTANISAWSRPGEPPLLAGSPPSIPVYILTAEAASLASILPDEEEAALGRYLQELRKQLPDLQIILSRSSGINQWTTTGNL